MLFLSEEPRKHQKIPGYFFLHKIRPYSGVDDTSIFYKIDYKMWFYLGKPDLFVHIYTNWFSFCATYFVTTLKYLVFIYILWLYFKEILIFFYILHFTLGKFWNITWKLRIYITQELNYNFATICFMSLNLWITPHLSNLAEPNTTILGNKELFIEAGSTINLTCIIRVGAMSDTHIFWNYNGKVSSQTFL